MPLNFIKHFLLLEDLRDAVKEGNGQRLATLSKVLLLHFKSVDSFNSYAIEMLTNITQNNMLLSQRLSNQCILAATASWKGGIGKNMEIDLLQENQNCDQKNLVRSMGANKTEKAITRASKASGGIREIVDNFDTISSVKPISTKHSHASSLKDEMIILHDLNDINPFTAISGRAHKSFKEFCNEDPVSKLDKTKFEEWCDRRVKKILRGGYQGQIVQDESSEESSDEE